MNIHALEAWYEKNHRKLSFRESKDPYIIWISEIMLQQTQVETVLPFFERFKDKYPNVSKLAQANEEELQKDVEGLGYYRRFRNMHLAAKKIVSDYKGIFPNQYKDLISLPGIGKYTAGAIMSIAYDKPYSALDGNVIRVLSRYLGIDLDMRQEKNKKKLDEINQSYIELAKPNIYTQAMMELGALICSPKQPKCELCPLQNHCDAYHHDRIDQLPVLSKLKDKKLFLYITLILNTGDGYYLRKRDEELLKGMYEYPQYDAENIQYVLTELEAQDIIVELIDSSPTLYKHVFTHQIWMMETYFARVLKGKKDDWIKIDRNAIKDIPMAVAHRKIKLYDKIK
ncbi:MAG: A/G-specific adenine glycosylase [Acholeplasmataceae bacterium]|nr:A/G-specific adenine glycosylase [Acholeplasmataceae bacterium]